MSHYFDEQSEVLTATRGYLRCGELAGERLARAWSAVVDATSLLPLTHLEAWERSLRSELRHPSAMPPRLESFGPAGKALGDSKAWRTGRVLSWLDLCSDDGFVREGALRTLSVAAPNAFFWALALRRLNDWVPEVRAAARESLPGIAKCSAPEHLVDALWNTLAHIASWERMDDADVQVLLGLVSIEPVATALKARIVSGVTGPVTAIFTQIGRSPVLDPWLAEIATSAVQPSVRARGHRSQIEERTLWIVRRKWVWTDMRWCEGRYEPVLGERMVQPTRPLSESVRLAAVDRSAIVRRIAADAIIQRPQALGAEALPLVKMLAADSSPAVAERARFALKQLESCG